VDGAELSRSSGSAPRRGFCQKLRQLGVHRRLAGPVGFKLFGAFGMHGQRFGSMLNMVEAGQLQPGKIVSRTVNLARSTMCWNPWAVTTRWVWLSSTGSESVSAQTVAPAQR
jgi:hypothetical protein